MEHKNPQPVYLPNRLGFHYFPDDAHYSDKHIAQWLPILIKMKVGWLLLNSPLTHAIPEDFIRQLTAEKINPIIDLQQSLNAEPDWHALDLLLSVYGKWGVRYALLDRDANMRSSWGNRRWGDPSLVNNYAHRFCHFAEMSLERSILPILGPLMPGGDFWDTAFMHTLLEHILEIASQSILKNISIAAYGWSFNHSLDWGKGGPTAWPYAGPFVKPTAENQNQQGFRSYEWLNATVQSVFGKSLPIFILEAGIPSRCPQNENQPPDLASQLVILELLQHRNVYDPIDGSNLLAPIPPYVKCGCFFVLSSSNNPWSAYRWFEEDGQPLPVVKAFLAHKGLLENKQPENEATINKLNLNFKYRRYLLILQELMNTAADIQEALHPYLETHHPKVGFSPQEATQAAFITVITPHGIADSALLEMLKANGNLVRVIGVDDIPRLNMEIENEYA